MTIKDLYMAKDESVSVSKLQLIISVAAIMITIVGSVIAVTMYINSIERRQSIVEGRLDAFDKYGSGPARDAVSLAATVSNKQVSDMAAIDLKLDNLKLTLQNNSVILAEVRADVRDVSKVKVILDEHIRQTGKTP